MACNALMLRFFLFLMYIRNIKIRKLHIFEREKNDDISGRWRRIVHPNALHVTWCSRGSNSGRAGQNSTPISAVRVRWGRSWLLPGRAGQSVTHRCPLQSGFQTVVLGGKLAKRWGAWERRGKRKEVGYKLTDCLCIRKKIVRETNGPYING